MTFSSSGSANKAFDHLNGHSVNDRTMKTSLFNVKNLRHDPYDFVPKDLDYHKDTELIRKSPTLMWHVATYKEGRENLIRASECIQGKVGKIPQENLKR